MGRACNMHRSKEKFIQILGRITLKWMLNKIHWSHLGQDREQWQALMNVIITL
jgi:hypothetical protein